MTVASESIKIRSETKTLLDKLTVGKESYDQTIWRLIQLILKEKK